MATVNITAHFQSFYALLFFFFYILDVIVYIYIICP